MAINGILDRWSTSFPASLVPQIIHLVLDSWKGFSTSQTHEVKMTQEFFVVLERNQESSKLPFLIDIEIILPNKNGTKQRGRLDIRFIHGHRRKIYFSIECKRLRVNPPSGFKSLAGDYVEEGMYRYFNGQYAQGLDKGGMLGYVMDGNVDKAIKDVKRAIEKCRPKFPLKMDGTIHCSTSVSSPWVQETLHKYGPKSQFILYHVFLPCKGRRVD